MINLLKLKNLIMQELEKLGDSLKSKDISKCLLYPYVNKLIHKKTSLYIKNPFSPTKILNKKSFSKMPKGLKKSRLPRQDDFRNFLYK